jgi:hypothetical protein
MTLIKWVESVPSNASKVGNAPTDFRSVWTAIATGMATEHFWPGVGGASQASAGELLPGASRTFVDAFSASSVPSQGTARLFFDTTNARLYVYESAGTYMVGSAWHGAHKANPAGFVSLRQAGALANISTGSGLTRITYPVGYNEAPDIIFATSSSRSWFMVAGSSTTTQMLATFSSLAGAASTATLYWEVLGNISAASI